MSPPPDLAALAAVYKRERDLWTVSPRAAGVRRRLLAAVGGLKAAAELLGDLMPVDLAVAALEPQEAHEALDAFHTGSQGGSRLL
jgi:hypothetical protein